MVVKMGVTVDSLVVTWDDECGPVLTMAHMSVGCSAADLVALWAVMTGAV